MRTNNLVVAVYHLRRCTEVHRGSTAVVEVDRESPSPSQENILNINLYFELELGERPACRVID